jgi:hypothetical protein
MMRVADQLPRIFQANADRFYQRVILKALESLPTHGTLAVGETADMDEFLDRCAAQVENHTANEAAKAFALTLDGMFERQLYRWAGALGVIGKSTEATLKACAATASLDLAKAGMADNLRELHLVANVVRHGEGGSCGKLKAVAPQLWDSPLLDYYDLAPAPVPSSEEMRIRPPDLNRYARAIVRFWGHVDPLPNAVLEPPY